MKIQDITPNTLNSDNDIDITVKSVNINNKASKLFNSGKHKVYNITLKNNQNITATSNHPLLVLQSDLSLQWKTVEELKQRVQDLQDMIKQNAYERDEND